MNGPVVAILFAVFLVTIVGRQFVQRWLMSEHESGNMSGRRAGWLFAATLAMPSLLVLAYVAWRDLGSALILGLALALFLPVVIIPWVAVFRYPDDTPESKRFPRNRS